MQPAEPMLDLSGWSAWLVLPAFTGAAGVIGVAGTRLAGVADELADATGLGEAVFGALLIGGATSLPGLTVSVVAGLQGQADLAVSNALGGIVAQTAFLAIADMVYRKANLEHAAASAENLVQASLLIVLLALVIVGTAVPEVTIWRIHPMSIVIAAAYLGGLRLLRGARMRPMWRPEVTGLTHHDEPAKSRRRTTTSLWLRYSMYVPILLLAGIAIQATASELARRVGLTGSTTGALLTAIPTSLPELVIAIAAVRRGALSLAVGDILGGNAFDSLFMTAADLGYGQGSAYHAAGPAAVLLASQGTLMVAIMLLGFVRREEKGVGNIGFESWIVLAVAVATYLLLFTL